MNLDHLYRDILENSPQLVVVVTLQTDQETGQFDLIVNYVNTAWERLTGSRADTIIGKRYQDSVYYGSGIPWIDLCRSALNEKRHVHQLYYGSVIDRWIDISITALTDNQVCINVSDVTENKLSELRLKEQNQKLSNLSTELHESRENLKNKLQKIELLNTSLEELAYFDQLTGLPNRTRFTSLLTEEIRTAKKVQGKVALAVIDVDNLQTINDTEGHRFGDELLRQIAQRIQFMERLPIIAGRFREDDFLVLIKMYEHDAELTYILDQIQDNLKEPYQLFDSEFRVTVSMGSAQYPDDADNSTDLLHHADIAIHNAKKQGKNSLALYHSLMQKELLAQCAMERKLVSAMAQETFTLYFQPQFDVQSHQLRGFETLVRWNDDEMGAISPDRFIPIAEESRLIIPFGNWILRTACETLSDWRTRLGYRGILSVNVSPVQLRNSSFVDDLKNLVKEYTIPPESLELEITEGVLIQNIESATGVLEEIRSFGVGISLDDFGTGYSSLCYLQKLPLSSVKIDKTFISRLSGQSGVEVTITQSIIQLVNKLGIDSIAEGVETKEQIEILEEMGCDYIQGFIMGKPVPARLCEELIQKGEAEPSY